MVQYSAAPSGAAGGDLAGTYPNPTVAKTSATVFTASNSVQVDNDLSCTDDLSVGGNSTLTGAVDAQDGLSVTGPVSLAAATVITFGADTNLYRNAANSLTTDDFLAMANGQSAGNFSVFGAGAKALTVGSAGGGLAVKEGSNARMGTLVLNGATPVVVGNTSVTATTRIFLTANVPGGTPGHFWVSARTAATSFSVTGTAGDTSTVAYHLIEPA